MKKLLMSAAMAAMFGALVPAAQAQVSGNYNVTVTLTSLLRSAEGGSEAARG